MRIVKFSVVGAIGIVVQIAVLASLTHLHVHYLVATVCAVEAAVLHNFCWHLRFTWRDRGGHSAWTRLARFHLSNAAVSLIGNVALMRVFVGAFGMQPVAANLLAVATCAVVNYLASDYWVFAATPRYQGLKPSDAAGRASALACVAQRERRSERRWTQELNPSQFDV